MLSDQKRSWPLLSVVYLVLSVSHLAYATPAGNEAVSRPRSVDQFVKTGKLPDCPPLPRVDSYEYNISPIAPGFELRAILASVQGQAVYDCLPRPSRQKALKNEEISRPVSVISPERVYSTAKLVNLVPLIISLGRLEDNPATFGKIDLSHLRPFGSVTEDIPDHDFQRTKFSTFTHGNQVFFRGFDLADLPTPGKKSMGWSLIQCAECVLGNNQPEDMQIFRVLTNGGQPLAGCGRHITKYTAQFWVYVNPEAKQIPSEFKKPFCKTVPEPLAPEPSATNDLSNE